MSKAILPTAEHAFRNWFSIHFEKLWHYDTLVAPYLKSIGGPPMPGQVVLPGALVYNDLLLEHGVPLERLRQFAGTPEYDVFDAAWQMTAFFAAYRKTRHTYSITDGLWECLQETPFPERTPTQALLYLPMQAFALNLPSGPMRTVGVWYDLLAGEEESGQLELRFIELHESSAKPLGKLPLAGSMDDALDVVYGLLPGKDAESSREAFKRVFQGIINVLLYIAGDDDIVRIVGHMYPKPFKKHVKGAGSSPAALKELMEPPSEAEVGIRFQQALIQYVADEKTEKSDETGRTVRPHVRRAHPHLYWTGEGRQIPVVKYLPPVAVRGGKVIPVPSIRNVQ